MGGPEGGEMGVVQVTRGGVTARTRPRLQAERMTVPERLPLLVRWPSVKFGPPAATRLGMPGSSVRPENRN